MAVTPNFSIPLYTTSDTAKLDTLLNGQATALDTNLKTAIDAIPKFYRVGLDSGRTSPVGWTPADGYKYYSTDTDIEWFHNGTAWVPGTGGLVLIQKIQFAAASTVVFSGFSAQFDNYQVVLDITSSSAASGGTVRLRSGATDNSAASYAAQQEWDQGTGHASQLVVNQTSFPFVPIAGSEHSGMFEFYGPALARVTRVKFDSQTWISPTSGLRSSTSGRHNVASVFDGFSYTPSTGTITGTLWVYGRA